MQKQFLHNYPIFLHITDGILISTFIIKIMHEVLTLPMLATVLAYKVLSDLFIIIILCEKY